MTEAAMVLYDSPQDEAMSLHEMYQEAGLFDPLPELEGMYLHPEMRPMPHQLGNMNNLFRNGGVWGFFDEAGCVSGDTEFLTPTGWKRIDEYAGGELVGQYHPTTQTVEFVEPSRYVKEHADYMVSIKGARGTDQLLSPNHKVLIRTGIHSSSMEVRNSPKSWILRTADSLLHVPLPSHAHCGFATTFKLDAKGKDFLSDAELRVMVAVIADGHFANNSNTVNVRLLKQRKIDRLRALLKDADIWYSDVPCLPDGFRKISFHAPRREKEFGDEYWGISLEQRKIVAEEFVHWDGSVSGGPNRGPSFTSTSKKSADFVQFCLASTGTPASLFRDNREHDTARSSRSVCYEVRARGPKTGDYVMPRPSGFTRIDEPQTVYCFTVSSGYLVLRRNGYIFATGNCGKTLPAQAASIYYSITGNRTLILMPPVLLRQFRRSLIHTFPGIETKLSIHTLSEGPYPVRLPKKRVQEIRQALRTGACPGVSDEVKALVAAMKDTGDVQFTPADVAAIRAAKGKQSEIANRFGCSTGAVSDLRNKVLREDLYSTWEKGNAWPDLLLMSYQMFLRVPEKVLKQYSFLVADEIHNALCHPSSDTFKRVRWFLHGPGRESGFLPMTATPIPNVPSDAYGPIALLSPGSYSSYREFETIHVDTIRQVDATGRPFTVVTGYRCLDLLRANLFGKAGRVTKEQVFTLAKPQIIEVDVELSDEHRALYRKLVRERVLEVNGETISAVQAASLRQKALQIVTNPNPFTERPIKDNQVKAALAELLDEIGCLRQEKVVIFGIYHKSIEAMAEWFSDYNPAIVYGKSDSTKNVEKFLTDDTCRLMIAHYKSGGVGLNLQDVCRYVICAEPTSVPADFTQATERVHRKGQTKVVTFYILKVLGTGWPKQVASMRGKMKLTRDVTLDKTSLLSELLGETDNED